MFVDALSENGVARIVTSQWVRITSLLPVKTQKVRHIVVFALDVLGAQPCS